MTAAPGQALLGLGDGLDINLVRRGGDNFKSPQAAMQFQLRQQALEERLAGKGAGRIHQVAGGQYVELGLEKTDRVFVVLVEYGDKAGVGLPSAVGPQHNQLPPPDRTTDNNTIWQADFNRAHFVDMYTAKMGAYYRAQSSGRYTVGGEVTEWVRVPFNGPRYGNNGMGDAAMWTLIADAINTWTKDQLASGKTIEQVKAYLQQFDQWDRYDYDKDGNFNEPDGYIDHFQIVHSGAGEETGGGPLGADAIWSHRWFAFYNYRKVVGPAFNKYGGLEFGGGWGANPAGTTTDSRKGLVGSSKATVVNAYSATPTGVWVGDYTVQPENGGLGVFAHEFGHDLGLPDHYDTTGNANNGWGYWNIMASGSYLGDGLEDIGSRPGDLSAWDKLQLGWLNYEVARAGKFSTHKLGPAETNTKQAQGLVVVLPPEANVYYLYSPVVGWNGFGAKAFWSGMGNNLDTSMVTPVAIPTGADYVTMRLRYDIEQDWDYAYVDISTDNGANWSNLTGSYQTPTGEWVPLTTDTSPNSNNLGVGITGSSNGMWVAARFDIPASATGKTALLRLRYQTDEAVSLKGLLADEIRVGSFYDGAEGNTTWTFNGFKVTTGAEPTGKAHYYLAEFRQYRDYDTGLETGPYTFGDAARPNWVYHFPYQSGLLVTYWDTSMSDDNTSAHPGEGRSLPVDAHPDTMFRVFNWPNGATTASPWTASVQTYDATFGLVPTDALLLPFVGSYYGTRLQFFYDGPSLPGNSEFNDSVSYWRATSPYNGVIVPYTGTTIRVVNTSAHDSFMQVQVIPAR